MGERMIRFRQKIGDRWAAERAIILQGKKMGSSSSGPCRPPISPDTVNVCSAKNGEVHQIPNSCLAHCNSSYITSNTQNYCDKLGSKGEWKAVIQGNIGSCYPNTASEYIGYRYNDGDCGASSVPCGSTYAASQPIACQREKFNGDPATCCLKDYSCLKSREVGQGSVPGDPSYQACFSDGSQKRTCDPKYRNLTGQECQKYLLDYCSGADLASDDDDWIGRWMDLSTGKERPMGCMRALRRNMFSGGQYETDCTLVPPEQPGCTPVDISVYPLNASGYQWAQQVLTEVADKYAKNGYRLGARPGEQGYNPFQSFLYAQVCCPYPALCQRGLDRTCSAYTAQRLTAVPGLANWCGCHLPKQEYDVYSRRYQINPECTPMCNREGTIPRTDGSGKAIKCTQSICLIDDITLNLVGGTTGNVNVGQVCGSCGGSNAQCSCLIENNSVTAVESQIGALVVQQACGLNNTTCIVANPDPNGDPPYLTVPCSEGGSDPFSAFHTAQEQAESSARRNRNTIIIIVILTALALIFVALLLIRPNLYPSRLGVIIPAAPPIEQYFAEPPSFSSSLGSSTITANPGQNSFALPALEPSFSGDIGSRSIY